ncbi:MAG: hypothetical protein R3B09_06075 [Nannocystaceae bacterium]
MPKTTTPRWITAVALLVACNERGTQPATPPARDAAIASASSGPEAAPEATPTTPPATTPPATTPPAITRPPIVPEPLTPEPPQPDLPPDAIAVKLAADLVALDPAAMKSVTKVLAALHLPPALERRLEDKRHNGKHLSITIDGEQGPLELRLVMKNGTYEAPRGNSPMRTTPEVDGVELRGAVGLPSPSPADATRVAVAAIDPDASGREVVTVWGDYVYFRPMAADGRWTLARYEGRAPFHYNEAERRALEDALVEATQALTARTSVADLMTERHAARLDPATGAYEFGAGSLHVQPDGSVAVALVGPLPLPRLFQANGLTRIETSFAHDYGQMVRPIPGDGFSINLGRYFFGEPYASREAEMGDPAEATFVGLYLVRVADAAP